MADFMQAVKWMKEGQKVRRKIYPDLDFYIYADRSILRMHNHSPYSPGIKSIEATDWEVYEEFKIERIAEGRRIFISNQCKVPNMVKLHSTAVRKLNLYFADSVLGMKIIKDDSIDPDQAFVYYQELDIGSGKYYLTNDGKFLHIHDITYLNGPGWKIASIITGNQASFRGDSRTNVFRQVHTEKQFRALVKEESI